MNIERTIEFIVKNQARMDARFEERSAQAEKRFAEWEKRSAEWEKRSAQTETRLDRLERAVAQNNRIVSRLARAGVSLRSDVRTTERNLKKVSEGLSEAEDKLNALIDFVDRQSRGNGRKQ